ncbi:MAG: Mut7-C RNAse domain-containing protein, partial [Halobacterium sp.]
PDYVADDADTVWRCTDCGQYFWRGSHWTDVENRLAEL